MTTPCQCPLAGWCETHGRQMNAVRHRQCREEPGYFEAFGKKREARPIAAPVPRPRREPRPERPVGNDGSLCVHRGAENGETRCGCGGGTKTTPTFACALHGVCSDRRATVESVAWCRWCEDFAPTAPQAPPS